MERERCKIKYQFILYVLPFLISTTQFNKLDLRLITKIFFEKISIITIGVFLVIAWHK